MGGSLYYSYNFSLSLKIFQNSILKFFLLVILVFLKDFIYVFFKEGKGGEREGEKQCVVASCMPPTGDLARHPGICPDCESNWQPFG